MPLRNQWHPGGNPSDIGVGPVTSPMVLKWHLSVGWGWVSLISNIFSLLISHIHAFFGAMCIPPLLIFSWFICFLLWSYKSSVYTLPRDMISTNSPILWVLCYFLDSAFWREKSLDFWWSWTYLFFPLLLLFLASYLKICWQSHVMKMYSCDSSLFEPSLPCLSVQFSSVKYICTAVHQMSRKFSSFNTHASTLCTLDTCSHTVSPTPGPPTFYFLVRWLWLL